MPFHFDGIGRIRVATLSRVFVQEAPGLAFFDHLADVAAAAILPHFRASGAVDNKSGARFDPVTAADREAEQAIRAAIIAAHPGDGIIGEEFGTTEGDTGRVWVIDPIDGTRSFISGLPVWGVLVGLLEDGRPSLGMMSQPFTGERYFGDGSKASYTGPGGPRDLRARACGSLDEAVLFTTSPDMFGEADGAAYRGVEERVRLARYGADCYAYCMVAGGSVDAVIEAGLQAYDILPLIPIIEGAGGRVTDWAGNALRSGGNVVATGDGRLHDSILGLLAGKA